MRGRRCRGGRCASCGRFCTTWRATAWRSRTATTGRTSPRICAGGSSSSAWWTPGRPRCCGPPWRRRSPRGNWGAKSIRKEGPSRARSAVSGRCRRLLRCVRSSEEAAGARTMPATVPRAATAALCLLGVLGCGQGSPDRPPRVPRPVAGDTVTPEVVVAGTWKGGQRGLLGIRWRVEGKAGTDLLLDREVPEGLLPSVAVTFFRGEQELPPGHPPRVEHLC